MSSNAARDARRARSRQKATTGKLRRWRSILSKGSGRNVTALCLLRFLFRGVSPSSMSYTGSSAYHGKVGSFRPRSFDTRSAFHIAALLRFAGLTKRGLMSRGFSWRWQEEHAAELATARESCCTPPAASTGPGPAYAEHGKWRGSSLALGGE